MSLLFYNIYFLLMKQFAAIFFSFGFSGTVGVQTQYNWKNDPSSSL